MTARDRRWPDRLDGAGWRGAAAAAGCLFVLAAPPCAAAGPGDGPETAAPRIRALNRCAATLLGEALTRSAIVRGLAARLEDSDIVVYLTVSQPQARVSAMPRGKTHFMSANAAGRFLQVWVDPAQSPDVRIAVLAHELQHTLEIAAAPDVRDIDRFWRFYEVAGTESNRTCARAGVRRFETAAAVAVEEDVLAELGQRAAPGAATDR